MKALIACSSSGGHINPALSFGNYLKSNGIEVDYLGFKNQLEEKIIDNKNLILIDGENSFKKNIKSFKLINLIKEVKKETRGKNYDFYIGFGGFINFLLLFLKKKKPLFIHEQNKVLGDTNKIVRLFSKKVFYTFNHNDKKGVLVGNPSCEKIRTKEFNYKRKLNVLFVFGSLGSKSLMKKLMSFDGKLNKNHKYTLVLGSSSKNQINYEFNQIKVTFYLNLNKSIEDYDIIVSRGGATTLFEILKSRTFAICIPSPYVKHNHQEKNVDHLYEQNLISKIVEKDLTIEKLNSEISSFVDYDFALSRYKDLSNYKIGNPNELIYQEIMKNVKN